MFSSIILSLAFVLVAVALIDAHGTVLDPAARQSLWRSDKRAKANYNDNQQFCGGFGMQHNVNGGKCGICGDNYADRTPRDHELGGKYGQGFIVKNYKKATGISVKVQITANHKGYFIFDLCNLDKSDETEDCFNTTLLQKNGDERYYLKTAATGYYVVDLALPEDLVCEHCVLRWTYVAGNNWGYCPNGGGALGCGPQEHFRACSDFSVQ